MTIKPKDLTHNELEVCIGVQTDNIIETSKRYLKALKALTTLQLEKSRRLKESR